MTRYITKSGMLVEERGRMRYRKGDKIAAFRVATGGYHGLLWEKRLERVRHTGTGKCLCPVCYLPSPSIRG